MCVCVRARVADVRLCSCCLSVHLAPQYLSACRDIATATYTPPVGYPGAGSAQPAWGYFMAGLLEQGTYPQSLGLPYPFPTTPQARRMPYCSFSI